MIKEIPAPTELGDMRKIKCFAWFPTKVVDKNTKKWYRIWFKYYTAYQQYRIVDDGYNWVTYNRTIKLNQ